MIETNIPLQITVVLAAAISFILILEAFGFLTLGTVKKILLSFSPSYKASNENFEFFVRLFVGGLTYALVFFLLGSFGLLSESIVILISVFIPVLVFIFGKRWQLFGQIKLVNILLENRWLLLGSLALLLVTFVLWFRPITNFDGLWYHIPISKLFLQTGSIADQGKLSTYSLQPSINYFWNLWPLSLPISTSIASIVINAIHVFFFVLSVVFVTQIGKKFWNWNGVEQFTAPIFIGGTYEALKNFGAGGNDLLGAAYGLMAAIFCWYILTRTKLDWTTFIYAVLLIVGLASIKIFFTIFAALIFMYLIFEAWDKLPFELNVRKRLLFLSLILLILFALTYLPWIVRSYFYTGRFLDPVGEPELTARTYQYVNSNPIDHWTKDIFERINQTVIPFLTHIYSPLVFSGILLLFSKDLRKSFINFWLLCVVAFAVTFFASIALGWRYYLPIASVIVFLGVVSLFKFLKADGISLFGKLLVFGFLLSFLIASIGRTIYATADSQGLPSIERDLYVSNFSTTSEYLKKRLIKGEYDYVQEVVPNDLREEEVIFIANDSDLLLHNLAYVKNPIIETYTNKKLFSNLSETEQLVAKLQEQKVRYLLVRKHKLSEVCENLNIRDFGNCDNPSVFQLTLRDKKWNVDWYRVLDSNENN